ncbi:amidohydrolase family protein [Rhodospirillaceae bacterium KN72]|uniref:Amidohydrolase family protein n=1 Tax=Pacificispira spongiicola TaxID=2729598 RepID=A0A7Y0HDG3_9PROT|nr:amidohydrolase family protein [Pacificispira spongiicola]
MIDTHQHLILRDRFGYAWADTIPALSGRQFAPEDFDSATADCSIVGAVYMEAGVDDPDYRAEARHVARWVRSGRYLGQIASCRPEKPDLADWLDECASLGVIGFRRILHVMPDSLSQTETFLAGLREIGRRGYTFDLCVRADQHGIAANLLRACPDQQFVLDHCGNPDIADDAIEPWCQSLSALATFPHLAIKLSGITANARADQQETAHLSPYLDRVLDLFGANRVVWGSDWPVCTLGMGVARWISVSLDYLSTLSTAEREAIAATNAVRVYQAV